MAQLSGPGVVWWLVAGKLGRLIAVFAALCAALGFSASASGASVLSWTNGVSGDSQLVGVSCPSSALCVAVDRAGNVLTSTDPGRSGGTWSRAHVDGSPLVGVSCPSVALCVAVDGAGNVLSSGDPAGGVAAWTMAHVDDAVNGGEGGRGLTAVSCPLVSLCAAVDVAGDVIVSANPMGGAAAWAVTYVDDGINYECYHYGGGGLGCQPGLAAVSCASVSSCVAVDDAGNVITSMNPTGGASAWSGADPYGAIPASAAFDGVSCPEPDLCVAVDNYGGDVVTWNPVERGSRKTVAISDEELGGVFCPAADLCFASDSSGRLYVSTDPTGGRSAWTVTHRDTAQPPGVVTGVSCPSRTLCVAVDSNGSVFYGHAIPSGRQIRALLSRQLRPAGRAATTAALVKRGGYKLRLKLPASGRIAIWWHPARDRARRARRPVLIASAHGRVRKGRAERLELRLTHTGRRLLASSKQPQISATGRFTPPGEQAITTLKTFTLTR